MNHAKALLLKAGLAAATALTGLFAVHGPDAGDRARRATVREFDTGDTLAAVEQGAERPEAPGFLAGDLLLYRFGKTRETRILAGEGCDPVRMARSFEGILEVRVLDASSAGWTLAMDLIGLRADGGPSRPGGRIFARMGPEGEIREVRFESGASEAWSELIHDWQFRLRRGGASWMTEESDATGRYRARYDRLATGEIVRRKLEYLRIALGGGGVGTVSSAAEGETRLLFDPVPARIDGWERTELRLEGRRIVSEGRFSYVRVGRERRLLPREIPAEGWTTALGPIRAESASPSAVRAEALEALEGLARLSNEEADGSAPQTREMTRLVQAMRRGEPAVEEVSSALRNADRILAAALMACLAAAGTGEAQQALLRIAGEDPRPDRREMALLALVSVESPVAEADDLLGRLAAAEGALADTALLVLAAVGDRVRDSHPERHRRIEGRVLGSGRFAAAGEPPATLVRAIGNLGPATVPSALHRAIRCDDVAVRVLGADALARVRHREADEILARLLVEDRAPEVRRAAVEALLLRNRSGWGCTESLAALLESAAADESDEVRRAARRARAGS